MEIYLINELGYSWNIPSLQPQYNVYFQSTLVFYYRKITINRSKGFEGFDGRLESILLPFYRNMGHQQNWKQRLQATLLFTQLFTLHWSMYVFPFDFPFLLFVGSMFFFLFTNFCNFWFFFLPVFYLILLLLFLIFFFFCYVFFLCFTRVCSSPHGLQKNDGCIGDDCHLHQKVITSLGGRWFIITIFSINILQW